MSIHSSLGGTRGDRENLAKVAAIFAPALREDSIDGEEWDRLAADFDGICQEQLNVFSEARWPGVVIDPLIFRRGSRVVGGCVSMYRSLPFGLGGLAIAKWGPLLADAGSATAARDYAGMVEALVERYAVEKGMMLSILPRAVPGEVNPGLEHLKARGFRTGVRLTHPNRYFVRIEASEDAQRASFAQKWRYHLNKAEKEGLA
ncbi:MAG: hypothetical protein WD230_06280, partial [Cucumibacter sp.]